MKDYVILLCMMPYIVWLSIQLYKGVKIMMKLAAELGDAINNSKH